MTSATAGPLRYVLAVRPLPGPAPYELDFLKSPKLPPKPQILERSIHAPGAQPVAPRLRQALLSRLWARFPGLCVEDWRGSFQPAPPLAHALRAHVLPPPGSAALPARGSAPLEGWRGSCPPAPPLTHALQARALPVRPPGLAAPFARGSARQAGRKVPTAESPTFEAVIDISSTAAAPGIRIPSTRGPHPRSPLRRQNIHRRRCRLHRRLARLGLRLGQRGENDRHPQRQVRA